MKILQTKDVSMIAFIRTVKCKLLRDHALPVPTEPPSEKTLLVSDIAEAFLWCFEELFDSSMYLEIFTQD